MNFSHIELTLGGDLDLMLREIVCKEGRELERRDRFGNV